MCRDTEQKRTAVTHHYTSDVIQGTGHPCLSLEMLTETGISISCDFAKDLLSY